MTLPCTDAARPLQVDAVSICGSDIALYYYNDVAKAIAPLPFIPGHEATGTVVKCGPKVTAPDAARNDA